MVKAPFRTRLVQTLIAAALVASPADAARILFARGDWAAIDFGARCEARSPAVGSAAKPPPIAGFMFDAAGPAQGEFFTRLRGPTRPGSTAMVTAGGQPFLLVLRGQWAWSRSPAQGQAIIAAARGGGWMHVESRAADGRRHVDHYRLIGTATAIDAAAAACAGKSRQR